MVLFEWEAFNIESFRNRNDTGLSHSYHIKWKRYIPMYNF